MNFNQKVYPEDNQILVFDYYDDPISALFGNTVTGYLIPGDNMIKSWGKVINKRTIPIERLTLEFNETFFTTDHVNADCYIKFDVELKNDFLDTLRTTKKKSKGREEGIALIQDKLVSKLGVNYSKDFKESIKKLIPIDAFLSNNNSLDLLWYKLTKSDAEVMEINSLFDLNNENEEGEENSPSTVDDLDVNRQLKQLASNFVSLRFHISSIQNESASKLRLLNDKIKTSLKETNFNLCEDSLVFELKNQENLLQSSVRGSVLHDYLLIKKLIDTTLINKALNEAAIIDRIREKEEKDNKRQLEIQENTHINGMKEITIEQQKKENEYEALLRKQINAAVNNSIESFKTEYNIEEQKKTHSQKLEELKYRKEGEKINLQKLFASNLKEDYLSIEQLQLIKDRKFDLGIKEIEVKVSDKARIIKETEDSTNLNSMKLEQDIKLHSQIVLSYLNVLNNIIQQDVLLNFNKLDFDQRNQLIQSLGGQVSSVLKEATGMNPNLNLYNLSTQNSLEGLLKYFSNVDANGYLKKVFEHLINHSKISETPNFTFEKENEGNYDNFTP